MRHHVVAEVLLGKRLPAYLATKGFLAGVGPQMGNEVGLACQRLATDVALEGLLAGVHPLVTDDIRHNLAAVGAVAALVLVLSVPVRSSLGVVEETVQGEQECGVPAVEGPAYCSEGHNFWLC